MRCAMCKFTQAHRPARCRVLLLLACMASLAVPATAEEVTISLISNRLYLLKSPFGDTPAIHSRSVSNLVVPEAGARNIELHRWQTNQVYWSGIYYTNGWREYGTNRFFRGEGFWLRNLHSNEWTVTITGALATAAVVTNSLVPGLTLIGYSYLAPVAMNSMRLTNISIPYIWGDTIWTWDFTAQVYRCFFYDGGGELGGGWQDAENPGRPTDYVLHSMEGFWFLNKGATSITWRAPAP